MEEIYRRNLEALARRDPSLAESLEASEAPETVTVSPSQTDEPTAVVERRDGTRKRLHSRRDPRRESRAWAESLRIPPSKTVALLGLGLGYPLEEILSVHGERIGGLWCLEASPAVFREMLAWRDWRKAIEDPRVRFFVGSSSTEFRRLAKEGFQQAVVEGVEVLESPALTEVFPEWYAERKSDLRDLIRQWSSEMLTVMERGPLFLRNTLFNLKEAVPRSFFLRDVGGALRGRPAILVSAGPSLNKNVSVLRRAAGRIPILVVDTALRVLSANGVRPDAVVSIDALGMSAKHFEGVEGLEAIPLIYDLEVAADVSLSYPGPKILVGNAKPALYSWLEEKVGPLEGLTKGLTVAQSGFLILAHYGCSPIVLVGQDLSFERSGGRTHASGVAFQGRFEPGSGGAGRWEDPLDPKGLLDVPILEVPANDGGTVPTTHALYSYLRRLEDDIALTGADVVNATEGGAVIRGTRPAGLADTLDTLASESSSGFPGLLTDGTAGLAGVRHEESLREMRTEVASLLLEAAEVCRKGLGVADKTARDLGWKELSEKESSRRFAEISDRFGWIRERERVQMLIDRGVMRSLYMLHKGDLPPFRERSKEDHRKAAERYRAFFAEALETVERGLSILG